MLIPCERFSIIISDAGNATSAQKELGQETWKVAMRTYSSLRAVAKLVKEQESRLLEQESQMREVLGRTGGATYVRWGRTSCPEDAELVYQGK